MQMVASLRRQSAVFAFVFAAVFSPTIASAATADFRALIDIDNNASTGCTEGGMHGVEQIFVTRVTTTGTTAQVTRTYRQVCSAGVFGAPLDLDLVARPAGYNSPSGLLLAESRLAFMAVAPGASTPSGLRWGFDVTDGVSTQSVLNKPNGNPIIYPSTLRRHSVGGSGARTFVLDGLGTDWANINPLVQGVATAGSVATRILKIYVYANTGDDFLYFRFDGFLDNNGPFAQDDVYGRKPNEGLNIAAPGVLSNDGDGQGKPLTAQPVSPAEHGTVVLNPDGSFTYAPDDPASLTSDKFDYKASNGTKESNVARVTVVVSVNPSQPVVAGDDAYSTPEDTTLNVAAPGVLQNDNDPDGQGISATLLTNPTHGSVTLAGNGAFTYIPNPNFNGTDSFTYRVSDGTSNDDATVTITVSNVNDAPKANNVTRTTNEETPVSVTLSATDTEPGTLTYNVGAPSHGVLSGTAPNLTYTPNANYFGPDSFTYTVTDSGGKVSNVATVNITVVNVNDAPSFACGPAVSADSTAGAASFLNWATGITAGPNEASQTLTFEITANTNPGLFSAQPAVSSNGTLTFTPVVNASGSSNITIRLRDDGGTANGGVDVSTSCSFTITVDAPPAVSSTSPVNGATNAATSTNVVVTFSENVTLSAGWLSITCGVTTITDANGVVSGGPAVYTFNPTADLPAGSTCNATVFAAQVADNDANDPPNNMAANYNFSFTTDAPPSVSSTTPANGATGVTTNANVVVNFSESVNATGASFTVSCATSGAHTFTPSAGPSATFTLDPTIDFTQGETCTVTVLAAGVTDADANDPPDNMLANYVFSFTVDAAPSVTAVTPVNGATNVATNTNLTVTFSEPVTITNSSVTISCANTGAHTVAVSGGPTTWTVDPTADFGNGELCTATVLAAQVADNDGNDPPDGLLANFVWSFTTDTPPSVTATTPTNASTTFPSTNITVTFDEAVNAIGSSFTISCTTSGSHTFALSGGPTTFTLDPTVDFTGGETCTVTVVAAQVTDADAGDPPDNMAANYVFSFGVDAAPAVTSTTPTNGAPQVASNSDVTVNFSESVNASGSSFTVSCATSGSHTFTTSASPNTTFTLNPNTDFTPGELCTVTVVAAQVTDVDAFDPPDNMLADYVFTFTVDAAPSVSSTTPVNGATDIGAATNVTVNFSESVNATGASFGITCGTSGAHTFSTSSSPSASFTLDPTADFTAGETCTVTVFAAGITDADSFDPPDNMLADYVFSFTIDVAPAVTAVTPLDTSTNVATNTNLSVTFSEPVTITNSSVTINCANTGAHTVAVSGGPTTWTIDPSTDFGNGELCTATVLAAQVSDSDTNDPPDNMLANFVWSFTTDNPPSVSATTPTNASTTFPSTNVTVTFDEAVNATGSSFTISCTTSGAHTFSLSGGPTTFTLDPDSDFTGGETCTVTVVAAQVTDADAGDPPDNMVTDYVFSFGIDAAPAVTTTTPTNGAPQVASNSDVTVNFSESVNASGSSFTISCATSGSHTFTTSASPNTTFTLNPNTDFTPGELCTVTVVAAQVTDVDAFDPPDNMLADYVFSFTIDQVPSVSSTTPLNGATDIGAATNVTVNFSESVNATGASFDITCATSGAHTFSTSASPSATFTLDPTSDFTSGETCTVTVFAAGVTDADAFDPPDNMLANYIFSFTIDVAPSVTAVTPLDTATNVATNTNLSVTFSEPVTITNSSVTINCANTGAHTVAVSGGPTTWTVDPTSDFGNGELCTATVLAAQVSDSDTNDPPDNMLANFVWSFTTDNPPSVTATTPTNASVSFPSTNITVTFDEAVNATGSSFTISCTTSGSHAFSLSGGPTTWTLDPTTDFTGGETCTVTVVAAQVTDVDAGDPPDNMVADYVFSFGIDSAPTVVSTSPTNSLTPDQASNINIVITYDEPVTAGGTAYTIMCNTNRPFVLSGNGTAVHTLDPNTNLPAGQNCTVSILASQITDVDTNDPPDNLAANYNFAFHVDANPQIVSTSPVDSSTVAANTNVNITWTESVNMTAVGISCTVSGAHANALSTSDNITWTVNPTTDFTPGETCTITVLSANVTDTDTADPPDNPGPDISWQYLVDSAPAVTTTTPANLAVQQANNANITVNFSESVNATTSSFTVSCATSGAHTFGLSSSPSASFTLDPDTDYTNGEVCTVTVVAAQITDLDLADPPDNMVANYVFTFTVDNPPAVTTTTPTEGSSTVSPSATITINFNESVNATTSSFTINCGGNQPYTLSASPSASFTLTPNALLPATACTVTVIAAQITDADAGDPPDNMLADFTLNFTVNTPPTAKDDIENALGNLTLTVSDANGVISDGGNDDDDGVGANDANDGLDSDPDAGSSITIQNLGPLTGTAGGTLTFTSGGGYTYHSQAGDTGVDDVFTYTIVDNNGATDTGQLTIHVGPRYIFVDDDGPGVPDGRDISPYKTLQTAQAGSAANDTFVIKQGSYTDFIVLQAGQSMYGDGAAAALTTIFNGDSFTVLTPSGTHPALRRSTAGNTITLATNNALRGIDISASSGGYAVAGTTFGTLTVDQNVRIGVSTVNNGGALNLDAGTVAGAGFSNVSASAPAVFGLRLVALAGSLNMAAGTITNATSGNLISGGAGSVSYGGNISHNTAASRIVDITAKSAGTVTFSGSLSSTGGGLYVHANTGGTYNFSGNAVGSKTFNTGANSPGVELLNNGGAVINFPNGFLDIDTTTAIGFTATGGGTLSIGGTNSTIDTTGAAANALIINGLTVTGTATFASINSAAAVTGAGVSLTSLGNGNVTINGGTLSGAAASTGLLLNTLGTSTVTLSGVTVNGNDNITGTNFGTLTVGTTSLTCGTHALNLNTGNVTGTFTSINCNAPGNNIPVVLTTVGGNFTVSGGTITGNGGSTPDVLDITGGNATIDWRGNVTQAKAAAMINITNNTGNVTFQTGTLSATNGTGLQFSNADGTYNFNGTTTLNGGNAGVDILAGSGGTFSFTSGTVITNPTGHAFVMGASAPNVTYAGTITQNTASQRAIDITGLTGGTSTFTGAIGSNGGAGVSIAGTGGTVDIQSAMTFNNTGAVFLVSGAGLTIKAPNVANVVGQTTAATGPGVSIVNSTIGTGGVVFQKVAVTGGVNGIVLTSTGSTAGFSVTGTGAADSGGTIQNTTGDAISLTSVRNVSLVDLQITNAGDNAIQATTITNGLTIDSVDIATTAGTGILGNTITGFNYQNASTMTGAGNAANEYGISITDLFGTNSISSSSVTGSAVINVFITNNGSTAGTLNITNSTLNNVAVATGGDGVSIVGNNSSNLTVNLTGANNLNNNQGDGIQVSANNTATVNVTVSGATSNYNANLGSAVNIAAANSAVITATVTGFTGVSTGTSAANGLNVINIQNFDTSTINATISGVTITGLGNNASGIRVIQEANGTINATLSSNNISGMAANGIVAQARAGTIAGSGHLNMTVNNNTVNLAAAAALDAISIESGSSAGGDTNTICLNMFSNTSASAGAGPQSGYRLRQRTGTTFNLQNFAGNGALAGDVTTWVNTTKSNTGTTDIVIGTAFSNAPANCPTP
jgi:methionine-rich copper-binding protein CopC